MSEQIPDPPSTPRNSVPSASTPDSRHRNLQDGLKHEWCRTVAQFAADRNREILEAVAASRREYMTEFAVFRKKLESILDSDSAAATEFIRANKNILWPRIFWTLADDPAMALPMSHSDPGINMAADLFDKGEAPADEVDLLPARGEAPANEADLLPARGEAPADEVDPLPARGEATPARERRPSPLQPQREAIQDTIIVAAPLSPARRPQAQPSTDRARSQPSTSVTESPAQREIRATDLRPQSPALATPAGQRQRSVAEMLPSLRMDPPQEGQTEESSIAERTKRRRKESHGWSPTEEAPSSPSKRARRKRSSQ